MLIHARNKKHERCLVSYVHFPVFDTIINAVFVSHFHVQKRITFLCCRHARFVLFYILELELKLLDLYCALEISEHLFLFFGTQNSSKVTV